jgi:hypothetical protein
MAVTLAATINSTTRNLTLSGAISGITNGDLFLLEDELVEFDHFKTPRNPRLLDETKVVVTRGVAGTTKAGHDSGTAVQAAVLSYVASEDEAKPDPVGTGGSGGVTVDNGTDPPAAVTTLVAPGAVIVDGTADLSAVLQLRLIGPFSIDYTMGALLSSEVEMTALASGTYVLNAWAFVTTHWTASPPLSESDLHMNIGVGNATDGTALATTDAAISARDADPGLPFALTENVANGAAGVSKSIVKVTDDGQFLCVDMQNFGAALTAGAADIYAIIAVPAS